MRCNHFVTERYRCFKKCWRNSLFCELHVSIYVCPFTTENGNICKAETGTAVFCARHEKFLRVNALNKRRNPDFRQVVYNKYEKSKDPERILKELIGRTKFLVVKGYYIDYGDAVEIDYVIDAGHAIRLLKLLNLYLNGKR